MSAAVRGVRIGACQRARLNATSREVTISRDGSIFRGSAPTLRNGQAGVVDVGKCREETSMLDEKLSRREAIQSFATVSAGFLMSKDTMGEEIQSSLPDVKITAVKTFRLCHQLKRPFGVSVSVPLDRQRTALLVKIETDAGLVGWGETADIGGALGAIKGQLGPRLIGKNPIAHRSNWRSLWGPNFGDGRAVGALDIALNDLRGQILNVPVAELWGGRLRAHVPVYASAMNYLEGEQPETIFPREAVMLCEQGFRAMKMRIGRYDVRREAAVIASVRDVVGPGIKLMADGNAAYTMGTALKMGRYLSEYDFEYFEEPLPQSPQYAGYEELRSRLALPLAGGEAVDSRGSAKRLIDRGAFDIIQPDVSLCGGIGELLFIAELARLSGVRCLPHCWGGVILIAATVHALAVMPDPHWGLPTDSPMLELDRSENPWRDEIAIEPIHLDGGRVRVPEKPGLGIHVVEEAVSRYAV